MTSNELDIDSYVAGLIDGEASVGMYIQKHTMGIGYKVQPQVVVVQCREKEFIGLMKGFCDRHNIDYSIQERKTRVDFRIQSRDSLEKLWDVLEGLLVFKEEQMRILVEELIPMMKDQVHASKSGFLKMMKIKKEMDSHKSLRSNDDRKYDYEYFKKKEEKGELVRKESDRYEEYNCSGSVFEF